MAKTLSTRQVKVILQAEKADALASMQASKLSDERTRALNYYQGDMTADVPKVEGRSGVVSTDVSDTIDGLMPGLMEIFAGSDEVVKFDPVGPEDEQPAEQETDFVNHVFMQKNPGFLILQNMFKDALLSKTGIVKAWWESKDQDERETYLNQDADAFALTLSDPGIELVEHTENDDGTHDFTVAKKKSSGFAKVENVPPEEFGVGRRTKHIQDAHYCFHEVIRTQSDLTSDGYDEKQIKAIPSYSHLEEGSERYARDTVDESNTAGDGDEGINKPMRPIKVTEHYCRMDYDGEGKTRLYRVTTAGDDLQILDRDGEPDIVEQSFIPFAVAHCDPMPHRFFGRSIADKTLETQRIKTVLTRALLDNIYLMNNQQIEVAESHAGDSTIDDLMNKRIGGIVRTKQPGGINPVIVQAIADKIIPYLQYFDHEREWKTGVSREGQGLDAEALQNQSATAARQLHNAAQAKLKLIARNFADGVEDMFWLLHAVIRKNGSQPETVRLRNQWVTVDPRTWKSRDDMTVTVGLGSGGKQEQLANVTLLANWQKEALMAGLTDLVTPKNIYNSAGQLVKALEMKDVTKYFTDPGDEPLQPKPDPKLIEIQMKAEIEKLQAQADIETNKQKVEGDLAIAVQKAQLEAELKREEHAMKMEEHRMKMVGTAMSVASKGNGKDAEGNPTPPDTGMIERLMAGMNQPKSGSGKVRLKKVGPGEWVKEDVQ